LKAPSALIFDMDGVLVDSEPLHKRAKELAFGQLGIELPESVYDSYKGRPDETMLPEILREHGGLERLAELSRLKREFYESIEHEQQAVPGAVEFVEWAKSRYRIALATSATPRNRKAALERLGIGEVFEVIVDHGRRPRPKPDPEVFLIAMRELGMGAGDSWIVEDSLNGIVAGKAAGCVTVGITTTFDAEKLSTAGADVVVASFAELQGMLESLPQRVSLDYGEES
jgi:HAD superfamily hydrolase (TIGR01509 family)